MNIKPFFARFLDVQKVATTAKPGLNTPSMQTMKYPSDNDTFDPSDRGYAVKLRREALPDPGYAVRLRREAQNLSESSLKEAKDCTPAKPGDIVTLAYPSDSDAIGGRLYF